MNTSFIFEKESPVDYLISIEKNFREMTDGLVSEEEAVSFIKTVLPAAEPCKNNHNLWFWMYEEPSHMPSDCRVGYVYESTYRITGIIIYALTKYESVKNIEGLKKVLNHVLKGCMGRNFIGHGFDGLRDFIVAMGIFAKSNINAFFDKYADEYAEFAEFFKGRLPLLEDLASETVIGDWGESYSAEATATLELLDRIYCPVRVFVYGTLMRGQRAHHYLKDAVFEGEYVLDGYQMYDLGSYPAIKCWGKGTVIGEVYTIQQDMLQDMDRYEGEGYLYVRKEVCVKKESESIFAYVYEYKDEPEGRLVEGRWESMDKEYVWYACYGSNLSADRFRCYIEGGVCAENGRSYEGCRDDKSLWIDSKIGRFPGRIFFANSSSSWGGKGVAFYDPDADGETIMRLYKITREQLEEVQRQEGPSERWYGRKVDLGVDKDGCHIYTITNGVNIPLNNPSDAYINLIKKALIEECDVAIDETDVYLCLSMNED